MLNDLIRNTPGPRYQAIVDVVSEEILSRRLLERERLPTHRELARQLGLDVGTASRAYAELRRRGMISGEVGRGTFVSETARDAPGSLSPPPVDGAATDLSHNFPRGASCHPLVRDAVQAVLASDGFDEAMMCQVDLGLARHRDAGWAWTAFQGLRGVGGDIAVTGGGQHGLFLALAALCKPGDRVMTEAITYFGLKSIAAVLRLELVPVGIDDEGLIPADLERACRESGAKVLCCSPTLHNPTAAMMSHARRHEIAAISRRAGLRIVEDDVYGFMLEPRATPLCALLPEQTIYVTSMSKCIGPGLRVGFVRFSHDVAARMGLAMRSTTIAASSLMAEVAARMIADGTACEIARYQRRKCAERQALTRDVLGNHPARHHPQSFHVWLDVPEGWTPAGFAQEARQRGTVVAPGDIFAISSAIRPRSVRLSVLAAADMDQLHAALLILRDMLSLRLNGRNAVLPLPAETTPHKQTRNTACR